MAAAELVRLDDVWVHYDGTPALEGVHLSLYQDDFLGIIGPNGGGKTTLLKVILGLIRPQKGEVAVMGASPQAGRRAIGYVPQNSLFDRDFPVSAWDVVLMGSKARLFRRYSEEDKRKAAGALETVGMQEHRERWMGELSGGQQQRVLIARALVSEPRLLLLDEPTANIDQPMQAEFYELLSTLKERMAIVLVTHDISAVSVHVEKIACLNRRLYYHGTKELDAEELEEAYQCPIQLIAHGVPHWVLKEHR